MNGLGRRPYLGWSTYSEQTINSNFISEQSILAQSDALRASGLQAHGFQYINLDAGWSVNEDEYGRTLWNTTAFPTFLEMVQHIHANGQKVGIYLNPGISGSAVAANSPILGTNYHAQDIVVMPLTSANAFGDAYKIDYTKPGAQEYINSLIDLYASWGIDFIKLDAVTPVLTTTISISTTFRTFRRCTKRLHRAGVRSGSPCRGLSTRTTSPTDSSPRTLVASKEMSNARATVRILRNGSGYCFGFTI